MNREHQPVDGIQFSVFTKPWKRETVDELAQLIRSYGFDGIEFPLRAGYQVEPTDGPERLKDLVRRFDDYGLKVYSVASSLDEQVFEACAEAQIPIIRTMPTIRKEEGWHASLARERAKLEAAVPLCKQYGVKVGIQNHIGDSIPNAAGLVMLTQGFDPQHLGIIWDALHNSLEGEQPEIALSAIWSHLYMVNLKNAYRRRLDAGRGEEAKWDTFFTTGRDGFASWRRVVDYLLSQDYRGVVCLTAEYTEEDKVNQYIAPDLAYAKSLFAAKGDKDA